MSKKDFIKDTKHYVRKDHPKKEGGQNSSNVIIYGKHAVICAIKNPARKILRMAATKQVLHEISQQVDLKNISSAVVDIRYFEDRLPLDAVHQGVMLEVKVLQDLSINDLEESAKLLVVLDQVTDPHNVGAILRSCAAFGADALIIPRDNSPPETSVMAKAASGALENIPVIRVTNLVKTFEDLKKNNFWIIGLDGAAKQNLHEINKYEKTVLVMGAEGKGMRRLTSENCDLLAKLPITDKIESLNVSNAAAIALYELARRN